MELMVEKQIKNPFFPLGFPPGTEPRGAAEEASYPQPSGGGPRDAGPGEGGDKPVWRGRGESITPTASRPECKAAQGPTPQAQKGVLVSMAGGLAGQSLIANRTRCIPPS